MRALAALLLLAGARASAPDDAVAEQPSYSRWRLASASLVTPLRQIIDAITVKECVSREFLLTRDPLAHVAVTAADASMCGRCFEIVSVPPPPPAEEEADANATAAPTGPRKLLSASPPPPSPAPAPFQSVRIRVSSTFSACAAAGTAGADGAASPPPTIRPWRPSSAGGDEAGCAQGTTHFRIPHPNPSLLASFEPSYPIFFRETTQCPGADQDDDAGAENTTATTEPAAGGRRLLQDNPNLPQQRNSNPSWMNGGGSGQTQQAQQQAQPNPQPQQAQQQGLDGMLASLNAQQPQQTQTQQAQQQQTQAQDPVAVYTGGALGAGWSDSSYGGRPFTAYTPPGKDGGQARCQYLPLGAATSFHAAAGAFSGRRAVEFWAYAGGSTLPDVAVVLASDQAECAGAALSSLPVAEQRGGWSKYWVPLDTLTAHGACGVAPAAATKVDLRNPHYEYVALLCVDNVRVA